MDFSGDSRGAQCIGIKINWTYRYMVVQVMGLNSSEERGNEHRINGGPRPNYYYQSDEPKTIKI